MALKLVIDLLEVGIELLYLELHRREQYRDVVHPTDTPLHVGGGGSVQESQLQTNKLRLARIK